MIRVLLYSCTVIALTLLALNLVSYTLAQVYGHGWAYMIKLPGAEHIIDVPLDESGAMASLWAPSIGLGTSSINFIY